MGFQPHEGPLWLVAQVAPLAHSLSAGDRVLFSKWSLWFGFMETPGIHGLSG